MGFYSMPMHPAAVFTDEGETSEFLHFINKDISKDYHALRWILKEVDPVFTSDGNTEGDGKNGYRWQISHLNRNVGLGKHLVLQFCSTIIQIALYKYSLCIHIFYRNMEIDFSKDALQNSI